VRIRLDAATVYRSSVPGKQSGKYKPEVESTHDHSQLAQFSKKDPNILRSKQSMHHHGQPVAPRQEGKNVPASPPCRRYAASPAGAYESYLDTWHFLQFVWIAFWGGQRTSPKGTNLSCKAPKRGVGGGCENAKTCSSRRAVAITSGKRVELARLFWRLADGHD